LPKEVQKTGHATAIVTDHYHYWEEMANGYIEWFDTAEFIRGHECDNHKLYDDEPVPKWVEKMCEFRSARHMRQYLDENAAKRELFLQVESFDVHEPFHVPEPFASMYTAGIPGTAADYNIWPPYQIYADLENFMAQTTPEELAFLKSQYYGKTTMVDKWFGKFMQKLDELDLWSNTLVIFTTDHGHDLGDRGVFAKQYPHYDSHANIPMIIWDPSCKGHATRTSSFTQTVDLFATVIEATGGKPPDNTRHSQSLMPILSDVSTSTRSEIAYGTFGQGVCISNRSYACQTNR